MATGFHCDAGATSIAIPSSVTYLDALSFKDAKILAVITFAPRSHLQRLMGSTFRQCTSLKSIAFPASLEFLPSYLFVERSDSQWASSPVETVEFERGSKLREISRLAFLGCDSLKSICLPASVEKISGASFASCGLTKIEIESGNKSYRVVGSFVMDLNASRVIRYFGSYSEVEVPDTVEILDDRSFSQCDSIRQVWFGAESKLDSSGFWSDDSEKV
jgi:hypothetical protein